MEHRPDPKNLAVHPPLLGGERFHIEVLVPDGPTTHVRLFTHGKTIVLLYVEGGVDDIDPAHKGCSVNVSPGDELPDGTHGAIDVHFYGAVIGPYVKCAFDIVGFSKGDRLSVYTSTIAGGIKKIVVERYVTPAPSTEVIYSAANIASSNHTFQLTW